MRREKKKSELFSHSMPAVIGVDFDNTIVSYDELIYMEAVERRLIKEPVRKSKKIIRNAIRELPDGEIEWQKIQAVVYGPKMDRAILIRGVLDFFIYCRNNNVKTYIVSHKTQYAHYDTTGTDLREKALNWLRKEGFFRTEASGLSEVDVFFESTRFDKINRIKSLRCTHFIDDLEETFLEASFPQDIEKILFNSHASSDLEVNSQVRVFRKWKEIQEHFFNERLRQ